MPKQVRVVPLTPQFAAQVVNALRKSAEICERQPETEDLGPHYRTMAELIENTPVQSAEVENR